MPASDPENRAPAGEFDEFAGDYDAALNKGLRFTGEKKEYYAEGRVRWLKRRLQKLALPAPAICLDYGCGTGTSAPTLKEGLNLSSYHGYDPSGESIEEAKRLHGEAGTEFSTHTDHLATGSMDMVFCNGVFHHIPPALRPECVAEISRLLKPGGVFAFWENNPWNPAVRLLMRLVPFDRDAIMLWPGEARKLVSKTGLAPKDRTFYFIFPSALAALRPLEPSLSGTPLGGQYLLLFQKP